VLSASILRACGIGMQLALAGNAIAILSKTTPWFESSVSFFKNIGGILSSHKF
jgi:hypothetical protein